MNSVFFVDVVADSRSEFLALVSSADATFYEVYVDDPSQSLETAFGSPEVNEILLRFDMSKHSPAGREFFCEVGNVEARAYGLQHGSNKPLPYVASFVRGIGLIGIAWSVAELQPLIQRTRKEKQIVEQLSH